MVLVLVLVRVMVFDLKTRLSDHLILRSLTKGPLIIVSLIIGLLLIGLQLLVGLLLGLLIDSL